MLCCVSLIPFLSWGGVLGIYFAGAYRFMAAFFISIVYYFVILFRNESVVVNNKKMGALAVVFGSSSAVCLGCAVILGWFSRDPIPFYWMASPPTDPFPKPYNFYINDRYHGYPYGFDSRAFILVLVSLGILFGIVFLVFFIRYLLSRSAKFERYSIQESSPSTKIADN